MRNDNSPNKNKRKNFLYEDEMKRGGNILKDIFVSQAYDDKPLVDAFIEFLQLALQIHLKEIYCTTYNPNELPAGEDFVEHIREHISDAKLVVLLITPNYLDSHFCMAELGAAWVMNSSILPIVVPPYNHEALKRTPLRGVRSVRRLDADIDVIAEDIRQKGFEFSIAIFNAQAKKFMDKLPELLEKIEKPMPVSAEEHNRLIKELEVVVQKNVDMMEEFQDLQKYTKQLEEMGPSKEIEALKRQRLSDWEFFNELVEVTKDALRPIDRIIKSALYYELRHENFWPPADYWDDVEKFRHEDKLIVDYDRGKITTSKEYPDIEEAYNKLLELNEFILEKASPEVQAAFKQEHRIPLTFNTNFWRQLLDTRVITNDK